MAGHYSNAGGTSITSNPTDTGITTLSGTFSGTGGLTLEGFIGTGVTHITGNNSYTGQTSITSITVTVNNPNGLGAVGIGRETIANWGAALQFIGGTTYSVAEDIILNSATLRSAEVNTNVTVTGSLTLVGLVNTISSFLNSTLTIDGSGSVIVNATDNVIFSGPGTIHFNDEFNASTNNNNMSISGIGTYNLNADFISSGYTQLQTGGVLNANAVDVLPTGDLRIIAGTVNMNEDQMISNIQQSHATIGNSNSRINIAATKTLAMTGNVYNYITDDTFNAVATISGGTLELGAAATIFTVEDDAQVLAETTISSVISGSGDLTKAGAGLLALSGENTYAGMTTVDAGELMITGSIAGDVSVLNASAVLTGTGTLGDSADDNVIVSAGSIRPGLTTVIGEQGANLGTLTLSGGNLTASGTGVINIQINAAGNNNDKISGIEVLDLYAGSVIVSNLGGALTDGQVFDLFDFVSVTGGLATDLLDLSASGETDESDTIIAYNGTNAGFTYWDLSRFLTTGEIVYSVVSSVPVIPEPSKALFLGMGVAAMLIRRRRKVDSFLRS
jgi:fibronectin-binding autotransporter adhesin